MKIDRLINFRKENKCIKSIRYIVHALIIVPYHQNSLFIKEQYFLSRRRRCVALQLHQVDLSFQGHLKTSTIGDVKVKPEATVVQIRRGAALNDWHLRTEIDIGDGEAVDKIWHLEQIEQTQSEIII